MTIVYAAGGLISAALLVYLLVAMLQPEKLS